MKNRIIYILLLLLGVTSCRDEMPYIQNPDTETINNWDQLFESYWKSLNYNYMFWDIDPTDWDKVYKEYKPKFEEIASAKFNDEDINKRAFEWIKDMSDSLVDHHMYVSINDLNLFFGKFVSEPLKVFQMKTKCGLGRLDYTPYVPQYLQPLACKRKLDIPIVILADVHSASMAEFAIMSVLALPGGNGVFIGERTHGGTGILYPKSESVYSGYIKNSNYEVYMCNVSTLDANGVSYEGKGIEPTIEVPLDVESYLAGYDNQLERAIEYINEH